MKPEILVEAPEKLATAFVDRLVRQAATAIAARGRFSIALPGGSVAIRFFPSVAQASVDWGRTDIFWSDERAVAITDPESNFALADGLLLRPAVVPQASLHRLPADLPDLAQAATAAEREMVDCLGDPPRLDLLLLGVGADGHVASLFPGHRLLAERRRYVAALTDAPKPPPARLTLTLAAIAAARQLAVVAFGAAKAAAIGAALGDPGCGSPLALALARTGGDGRAWLLLDPAAARELPAGSSGRRPVE